MTATPAGEAGERKRHEPTEEESLTADRERSAPAERGAEGAAVVDPLSLAWWAPPLFGPPDPIGTTEVMEPARGGALAESWHLDPRRRRRVRKQVLALLCGLGERPGDVAESLRRAGARGDPGHGRTPVVRFLAVVVSADPLVEEVTVADGIVTVTLRLRWRATVRVPLPPPVVTFAAAFEQGLYPELARLTEPGT